MSDKNEIAQLRTEVEQLSAQVQTLLGSIRRQESPLRPFFLARLTGSGTNSGWQETVPDPSGGTNLTDFIDGRFVSNGSGTADFHLIPLGASNRAVFAYGGLGSTRYVDLTGRFGLKLGKVVSVGPCNAFAIVKECDSAGNVIDDTLVAVLPTKGGCDAAANGYCYSVGAIIAYEASPFDPTTGYQVGAVQHRSIQYTCADTNSASIDDVLTTYLYPGDFNLTTHSSCGSYSNGAVIAWRGLVMKNYAGLSDGGTCGGTNTGSTAGVKVIKWDPSTQPADSGSRGTDYTTFGFHIDCADTTDNQPNIGGGPCSDPSNPKEITVKAVGKLDTFIKSIDSISCNTNTGQITLNYTTGRAVVHGF